MITISQDTIAAYWKFRWWNARTGRSNHGREVRAIDEWYSHDMIELRGWRVVMASMETR